MSNWFSIVNSGTSLIVQAINWECSSLFSTASMSHIHTLCPLLLPAWHSHCSLTSLLSILGRGGMFQPQGICICCPLCPGNHTANTFSSSSLASTGVFSVRTNIFLLKISTRPSASPFKLPSFALPFPSTPKLLTPYTK